MLCWRATKSSSSAEPTRLFKVPGSLPGGKLEWGETLADAVQREVYEETGLLIRPIEIVATLDLIVRESDAVTFHYVLVEWACLLAGPKANPIPGDDAAEAHWVPVADLPGSTLYSLDQATLDVIVKAVHRLETPAS